MNKLLIGLVSGAALLGLAACGDTDDTTTQSVEPDATQTAPETAPATPPAATPPADTGAGGGADTGTAQ
ncbi:hypothetical protein [Chelativorans sp. AA-79]|uniref:hypothetical protein n=1 Tax=Chelativorans sp. AA-79 TaxID=3028735 RepID=UPI0023F9251E|nr:hypothetical protein [Chelativorans sp. AA-79]WEX11338.1 hypothetical protein PVE73_10570 [Chelativorans sp. AA-79]